MSSLRCVSQATYRRIRNMHRAVLQVHRERSPGRWRLVPPSIQIRIVWHREGRRRALRGRSVGGRRGRRRGGEGGRSMSRGSRACRCFRCRCAPFWRECARGRWRRLPWLGWRGCAFCFIALEFFDQLIVERLERSTCHRLGRIRINGKRDGRRRGFRVRSVRNRRIRRGVGKLFVRRVTIEGRILQSGARDKVWRGFSARASGGGTRFPSLLPVSLGRCLGFFGRAPHGIHDGRLARSTPGPHTVPPQPCCAFGHVIHHRRGTGKRVRNGGRRLGWHVLLRSGMPPHVA